jgi:DNA excision repair protein ERCC-3
MPKHTDNRVFQAEEFEEAITDLLAVSPVVTSRRVADRVRCSRERARQFLLSQFQDGVLERQQVGGGAIIYYPSDLERDAVYSPEGSIAPTQSTEVDEEQTPKERVLFFPSRREIAVDRPQEDTRSVLSQAGHLVDSTEQSYLYKVSEADVWNAPYEEFNELREALKSVVGERDWDDGFETRIRVDWTRAHQFRLATKENPTGRDYTVLQADDESVFEDVAKRKLEHNEHYTEFLSNTELRIRRGSEAAVKETLYAEGYPIIDERRIESGESLRIELNDDLELRDYQKEWVNHFSERKSGVFVGPAGSGKTVAAIAAMADIGDETLIIVPTRELAQQWKHELMEKTNLTPYDIGQYHGGEKKIRPVTVATYDTAAMSRHRELFNERGWGLVVADECHHAVASTWKRFRDIQSKARLGLSATPIRESGDAKQIYSLIGPPVGTDWGSLFSEGWVAKPTVDIRMIPWASDQHRERYKRAKGSRKPIEAAKNPTKIAAARHLLDKHNSEKTLIFVDWIEQGKQLAEELDIPFIYGETTHENRQHRYQQFRDGALGALIISRIGDEGIDLPDAGVAILASTRGASRAQTGQRAGRTMRPFGNSQVYVLLTKGSGEEEWGRESTQYLAEKGIEVTKEDWEQDNS